MKQGLRINGSCHLTAIFVFPTLIPSDLSNPNAHLYMVADGKLNSLMGAYNAASFPDALVNKALL